MPIVKTTGPAATSRTYVMIHGTPGDHRDFEPVVALAPPNTTVAWVDLLDHGSAPDDPSLDLDQLEDDLVECVESAQGAVTLVGYSIGAYLAGRVLPSVRAKVERAVLLGGPDIFDPELAHARAEMADGIEHGALSLETLGPMFLEMLLGSYASDPEHVARASQVLGATPLPRLLRTLRRLAKLGDPDRVVPEHDVPAVVMHATGDRVVPVALGERLAARGRRSRLIRVETDSHALPWTHAADVAQVVFGPVPS